MTIEHSNVRLLIAGDGELYGEISDQIQQHSLESKINLLGYVTGDKKLDCLTAADIVIIPSIITDDGDAEGLPVSLLEGLAAGKICIATDVSGADDILTDKKDGLLINQKSPEDINRALNMVLNFSAEEIADMKNAANTLARDYDWSSIAEKHMKHFSLNVE